MSSPSPPAESPPGAVERFRRFIAAHPVATGVALFVLASATRLALIRTGRFTGDEIETWSVGKDIAAGKAFPLLGPVISGGIAREPGPLIYWVAALPLLLTKAPEACNAFVALLGGVTVVLFWQSIRHYFTEVGALLAGVLMACSPWSTLYADRIWNPNVVGLSVALAFWAACRLRRSPSLFAVVVLFVSTGASLQLHMSAPAVWVALLPIWLPSVRRWRWYWPLVATAATIVLYAPMLKHELASHWSNTLAFVHETSTNTSTDYRRAPSWAFRLMTLDVSYLQMHGYWNLRTEPEMLKFLVNGNEDFKYGPVRWALLGLSYVFAAAALVIAGVYALTGAARKGPHPFFWAGVLGLAANTALLGFAHKEIHGHYIQEMLPIYFVAFAALGDWAARRRATSWVAFGAALVVCIGGVDAALWESSTLDARNGLGTYRRVIAAVEKDVPDATRASIIVGYRSMSAERLNLLTALDTAHPFRFDQGDQYRLLVNSAPPPKGARLVLQTGPVTLYRTR